MSRVLKWVLLGIAVAVVAGVVTVELISWNFLKPWIAEQVESATGREFSIDGDVDIDLLPRPRITLHEVSLANPEWAEAPHLIELDRLRVAPALLALATGQLALARIDVDAPVVRLINRSDGTANWVLADAGEGDAGPVPVRGLDITDAEIRYRSPKIDRTLALDLPSIRLRDDGESANTQVMVGFQGREIEIEADTDSFFSWDSPAESFDGRLRIVAAESRIDSEFSLPKSSFPEAWKVRLEADIEDIDRWLERIPGAETTGLGTLAFEARLGRDGTTWKAEALEIATMQGSLQADLAADTGGDVPALSGSIRAKAINMRALRPAGEGPATESNGFALPPVPPVLPRLAGSVDVSIEQIAGLDLPTADSAVRSATARVRFDAHRLAVEDLVIAAAGGTVQGSARLTSSPDQVAARVTLSVEELRLGEGDSAASNDDETGKGENGSTIDGNVEIELAPVPRDSWDRATLVHNLEVKAANLHYADPAVDTRLSASATLAGEDARPVVALSGTLAGRPLEAEIEGDALSAAAAEPAYGLQGRATSADLALSVDTTLDSVLNPARFEGRLTLSGDSVDDLEPWLGFQLVESPLFRIDGRLDRDGAQWKAEELAVELGESRLRGDIRFDAGERPRVVATLEAAPLDLAWMQSFSGSGAEPADSAAAGGSKEKRASDLAWLRAFDANLELDASELILPGAPRLVDLETLVVLEAGEVDIERLGAGVADGTFSVEGRLDAAEIPASGRIDARFDEIALQRLGDTFTPLEDRLGRLSGSMSLGAEQTLEEDFREDIVAPMLGRITIESSEFRFTDSEAGTDLKLSAETERLADGEQRFRLDGEGQYDGDPAWVRYRSDALLDVRVPDRPYAVDLDISLVQSRIEIDGTLMRPLALEGLDLELVLNGPNPQRLTRLLGVPLPDLPSYRVAGRLELDEERWSLSDLDGTVGESDLRGRLAFDVGQSPPMLTGELRSDSLDIDDLAGIAGVEPSEQEEQASDRFVLPDDPLVGDAWRDVSANVRYSGKSVRAGDVPLTDLVIGFRLDDGHARFEPVGFGVGEGSIDFILDLDARSQPAEGTLSVEVRGVDLRDALEDWDLADDSAGIIGAQGKFWVTGESIAELLGSADGGLVMLMTEGRLEALLVELAGLDASQAFLAWLGDREAIPINCAYVDLKARSGMLSLDTFVVDSEDTIFTAGGRVDLDDERLDISVVAHPQDASVLIGRTPFHLGGTFDEIEAGLHGGELAMRLGAGAGLATLASPLAALVPLLEAGGNDRTGYCRGLIERTMEAMDSDGDGP